MPGARALNFDLTGGRGATAVGRRGFHGLGAGGLAVFTQPVHTMTGIIAQEMGEVVRGSLHYRALFMVGIVLFFLSLLINYVAQSIVRRYRIAA